MTIPSPFNPRRSYICFSFLLYSGTRACPHRSSLVSLVFCAFFFLLLRIYFFCHSRPRASTLRKNEDLIVGGDRSRFLNSILELDNTWKRKSPNDSTKRLEGKTNLNGFQSAKGEHFWEETKLLSEVKK